MKLQTIFVAALFLALSVSFSCFDHNKYTTAGQTKSIADDSPFAILLKSTLKNSNDSIHLAFRGKELYTSPLIKEFYFLNQNHPVWTSNMEPNNFAVELLNLLAHAQYYGLDTSFYQFSELKEIFYSLKDKKDPELNKKAVEFELLMTHNSFKLMSHLHAGLLDADTSVYGTRLIKYPTNFPDKLAQFITNNKLSEGVLNLQPKSYEYKRLQMGLEYFLANYSLSEDSFIMPDPAVDSISAYQKAREILISYNYLKTDIPEQEIPAIAFSQSKKIGPSDEQNMEQFSICAMKDYEFFNALKKFQIDHGLSPDGKIGANTIKALLINNRERFEQIAVNLERLRWEKSRPSKYVYVNVPAYKLRVIDSFNIVKTFNVVVGAPWSQTPELNSEIEYFTTNPEWYVPYSISTKEILPKVKQDSTYLARHNYKIFDKDRAPVKQIDWSSVETRNFNYFFQQSAGPNNAMGKIKFYFENPYIVYIHDTNDKSKFNKDIRAYSHGCMRLQNPSEFAIALLKTENNGIADSVDYWLSANIRKVVNFNEHIPLFVRYVSCEADSKGHITFYQDIYGKDKKLREELFAKNDF